MGAPCWIWKGAIRWSLASSKEENSEAKGRRYYLRGNSILRFFKVMTLLRGHLALVEILVIGWKLHDVFLS
jgi:hypothetical protein